MSEVLETSEIGVIERMPDYAQAFKRRLKNGRTIYLIYQIFNYRLAIGWTHDEETGYDDFYCYTNELRALCAFVEWDGTGDPLDGWVRHGASERRRTGGNPAKEYAEK